MHVPGVATPKLRSRWEQTVLSEKVYKNGKRKPIEKRVILEVIAAPTLSSPVGLRVVKNEVHPHRVGKHTSMTQSRLLALYSPAR